MQNTEFGGVLAALFALHPLRVESVAWVAERKDVLSTFFFLLTLWAYARYAEGECRMQNQAPRATFHVSCTTLPALLLEKLPFLALSAASSVLTIPGHESLGALVSTEQLPVSWRLANAVVACALYLRKLVWPVDLSVFYLHPGRWPAGVVAGSGLVWLGLTVVAVKTTQEAQAGGQGLRGRLPLADSGRDAGKVPRGETVSVASLAGEGGTE